jgi:hypothetical protein
MAFINEVLDAKPTAVTPKFDDYTPGSYHVIKEDLLEGIVEEATKRKLGLRGVLIVGPTGPLWTYVVAVFIRDEDQIRVNVLVFPHARITYKATGLVTAERYDEWVAELRKSSVLRREPPEAARKETDEWKRDYAFKLLLATWDAAGNRSPVDSAQPDKEDEQNQDQFYKLLNSILKDVEATYDPFKD